MVINQGDIYWVQLENPTELESNIPHPHVIIQDNLFNHSRIPTVIACALTTNMKKITIPGNVLLEIGEANLSKQSIVEVAKLSSLDKTQLGEYIGSLNEERVNQILAGIHLQQASFFTR
ncbi:MAG: type II toxin-antitoxin system PemK/MazF family toxin [bacterium]|nr:type II toxin-antitoxin system PemK/MazF family toxin [bacterium]